MPSHTNPEIVPAKGPHELGGSLDVASPGEETYVAIRKAILEGTLVPGARIVEQQLAETLKVSRTPVREALLKLERENLVSRVGRGMAVRTYSSGEVRDTYDVRVLIEGHAARAACEGISAHEIAALEQVQEELERVQDGRDAGDSAADAAARSRTLAQLNQRFHSLLVLSTRNEPLHRCFTLVVQLPLLFQAYLWYDDRAEASSVDDHHRLIELVQARDGDAAEAHWRRHIEFGRDVLIQRLVAEELEQLREGGGA
jgi:DNA-binding GntR family transcriptional regulator